MDTKNQPGFGRKIELFLSKELPPKIVIAFKALLLYVFFNYYWLAISPHKRFPFIPFIEAFDTIPPFVFSILTYLLFLAIISSFLKLVNYRLASLLSGFIILFLILSSKNLFSNSLTFVGCLLILIGLYRKKDSLFRIQIALLYVGASTNKMIDPDWWNGQYFDFFFRDIFDVNLYKSFVPENSLAIAKSFGIATIFTELFLGMAVLIPKITRLTIIAGFLFHASMLVITSGILSTIFFYIMCAAFLLISDIEIQTIHLSHKFKIFPKLISYLDPSDSVIATNQKNDRFTLQTKNGTFTNIDACKKLLFSKQVVISVFFLFVILQMRTGFLVPYIIHPILSAARNFM